MRRVFEGTDERLYELGVRGRGLRFDVGDVGRVTDDGGDGVVCRGEEAGYVEGDFPVAAEKEHLDHCWYFGWLGRLLCCGCGVRIVRYGILMWGSDFGI